jgi:putative phosphoesterase
MRIVAISDLHVDTSVNNKKIVDHLVSYIESTNPSVLCFLGDLSPDLLMVKDVLQKFSGIKCKKLFVPGNHDVWIGGRKVYGCEVYGSKDDSLKKFNDVCRLAGESGWVSIQGSPVTIDDVGFVGDMQWYDYSFKDSDLKIEDAVYETKSCGIGTWMDGEMAYWGMSDQDVTDMFNRALVDDLSKVSGCHKIVCCSHFIPFKLLQYGMHPTSSFFNAYGGNEKFGKNLMKHKVDISLSGHLHRNFQTTIDGILCYQTAIGYLDTLWPEEFNPRKILDERVLVLDIN